MHDLQLKSYKRDFLNALEDNIQKINDCYISKYRSKTDISSSNRAELLEIKDKFAHYAIDHLLSFNVVYLYEIGLQFLSFCVDFPKQFTSLDELNKKVKISIYLFGTTEGDFQSKTIKIGDFERNCDDYLYLSKYIRDFEVFELSQGSQFDMARDLFVGSILKDNEKDLSLLVEDIKSSESLFLRALESKNSFMKTRRSVNRARKDHKKTNKSQSKNAIEKNNSRIKQLEREIQRLRCANVELKVNGSGQDISDANAQELLALKADYNLSCSTFIRKCSSAKLARNSFIQDTINTFFKTG